MTISDNSDDFNRKYTSCYALAKLGKLAKVPQVIYVKASNQMSANKLKVYYTDSGWDDKGDIDWRIISSDNMEILSKFPDGGYFNHDTNCYFVARTPYRQWKQGINDKTVTHFGLTPKIAGDFTTGVELKDLRFSMKTRRGEEGLRKPYMPSVLLRKRTLSIPFVKDMFFKDFPSFMEAIDNLKNSKTCCTVALSPYLAVGFSATSPNYMLYSYMHAVGESDINDPVRIKILEPLFHQEISDYFQRNGINARITN